jgi:hypothetical protein
MPVRLGLLRLSEHFVCSGCLWPPKSLQFISAVPLIGSVKPILLSDHALRYMSKRGFTIAEVEKQIGTVPWQRTDLGRLDCRKDFPYGKEWNRKVYPTKQVRPVFVEEVAVSQAEFTERSLR